MPCRHARLSPLLFFAFAIACRHFAQLSSFHFRLLIISFFDAAISR
jgi:hypothetical protein